MTVTDFQALHEIPSVRVGVPIADIVVTGQVNGLGEADIRGSYLGVGLAIGHIQHKVRISIGGAQQLAAELRGLLPVEQLSIDRFVGSVIDAYTSAPNDEDARRDAVQECVKRSGWRP